MKTPFLSGWIVWHKNKWLKQKPTNTNLKTMPMKHWNDADFPEDGEQGLPAWGDCHVRELLLDDLKSGVIPRTHQPTVLDTREIFLTRPEYKMYGFKNFYSRLSSLRAQLDSSNSQASNDSKAFAKYVKNYPPKDLSCRGYPHWEGSKAQTQLKLDVDNGLHTNPHVTPMKMWTDQDKPEYRDFPQAVFRGHLYQEIRTRKYHNYLEEKEKEEKTQRMERHEKALARIKAKEQKAMEKEHMEGLIKYSSLRKKANELDLKTELLFRGVEEECYNQLRTFTNRRNKLKELEVSRVKDELEWKQKTATKAFKKLSAAPFQSEAGVALFGMTGEKHNCV